jgi:hypothetical protein
LIQQILSYLLNRSGGCTLFLFLHLGVSVVTILKLMES